MQCYKKYLVGINSVNTKFNLVTWLCSLVVFYMLVSPYEIMAGVDMLFTIFSYMVIVNTGLFLFSILKAEQQKTKYTALAQGSLVSLVLSIIAPLAERSLVIPEFISIPLVFLTTAAFFFALKGAYRAALMK